MEQTIIVIINGEKVEVTLSPIQVNSIYRLQLKEYHKEDILNYMKNEEYLPSQIQDAEDVIEEMVCDLENRSDNSISLQCVLEHVVQRWVGDPQKATKAINIKWDTDGEEIDLPTSLDLPDNIEGEDEISDFLSNTTGFCHFGFTLI